jgi:hypothetical protein
MFKNNTQRKEREEKKWWRRVSDIQMWPITCLQFFESSSFVFRDGSPPRPFHQHHHPTWISSSQRLDASILFFSSNCVFRKGTSQAGPGTSPSVSPNPFSFQPHHTTTTALGRTLRRGRLDSKLDTHIYWIPEKCRTDLVAIQKSSDTSVKWRLQKVTWFGSVHFSSILSTRLSSILSLAGLCCLW